MNSLSKLINLIILPMIVMLNSSASLFNNQNQRYTKSIIIEHIGIQDKPIFALYIFPSSLGISSADTIYTSRGCYNYLCSTIKASNATTSLNSKRDKLEFGTFLVTIDGMHNYYFVPRKKSIEFFSSLIKNDSHSLLPKALSDRIDNIIKRIYY